MSGTGLAWGAGTMCGLALAPRRTAEDITAVEIAEELTQVVGKCVNSDFALDRAGGAPQLRHQCHS